jgi:hypothetical protein
MGLFLRALAAAGAAAVLLPSTGAARTWGSPVTIPAPYSWSAALAPLPAAGSILAYQRGNDGAGTRVVDGAGSVGGERLLAGAPDGPPAVATDDAGEAVIAWSDWSARSIDIGVRAADGSFAPAAAFPAHDIYDSPRLAVSPGGWAAVAFSADTADGEQTVVSVRPPGGSFAAPVEVAAAAATAGAARPNAIAIDDSGEVVVGYAQDGVAHVVVRGAGELGVWAPPQALGAPFLDPSPAGPLPLVGIDADGGAVAVWEEGGGLNLVAPVWASFRPPGGSFGPPQDLGVETWDGAALQLAVSAFGEAILVVAPARQGVGGVSLQPLAVFSGSTALGRFAASEVLSDAWLLNGAQLAMNARGDAVVAYVSCCPERLETRRRAPFGPFEDEQDVPLPASSAGYYSHQVGAAAVDPFGNATVTWVDFSADVPVRSVSADAPVLASAPDVVRPSSGQPTDLIPAPAPAAPPLADPAPPPYVYESPPFYWFGFPPGFLPPGAAPEPSPAAPASAAPKPSHAAPAAPLAVAVPVLPALSGRPRIVVAVRCPAACRASVSAVLVTPRGRRLRLPRVALTADVAGIVTAPLRLSPAAARALRVASPGAGAAARLSPRRRFGLSLTVTAGDRGGAPQVVSIELAFTRR